MIQIRLYLAERLMVWAFHLLPRNHPARQTMARAIVYYCMSASPFTGTRKIDRMQRG